jgi:hypothetical protein
VIKVEETAVARPDRGWKWRWLEFQVSCDVVHTVNGKHRKEKKYRPKFGSFLYTPVLYCNFDLHEIKMGGAFHKVSLVASLVVHHRTARAN